MKKLFWDVEITDLELAVRSYQLKSYIKYFDPKMIKRDWTMLGAAWAFNDDRPVAISISPRNPLDDEAIIRKLHDVLAEADVLIGHNSDNFDIKKFNTRAVFYGLPPLTPKVQIDTLKIARKYFKFTSNKLSYITEYLGLTPKDDPPDWDKIINGDPDETRKMRHYNKLDVISTRDLYHKLKAWHHTHPITHEAVRDISGNAMLTCDKCGSAELNRNGFRLLSGGRKRQTYQCKACGGLQSGEII